jgi:hypothetical protein
MKREPRGKFDRTKMVSGGQVELSTEEHQEAIRQIAIADEECRVNFRWGSMQLEIVKQVAKTMGVSYQQYIKQVVYRQAYADLQCFSTSREARREESRPVTKENTQGLSTSGGNA